MKRIGGFAAAAAVAMLVCGVTGAAAQGCVESVGEASAPTRDVAVRIAYESMLRRTGDATWRQWLSRGQRIGDAPGFTIRKLTTNCTPRSSPISCRVTATLCR